MQGRSVEELRESAGEALPLFQAIREAGTARERLLVVETLRASAEGRVRIKTMADTTMADTYGFIHRTVTDGQGRPIEGLDLTGEIEAGLRGPA